MCTCDPPTHTHLSSCARLMASNLLFTVQLCAPFPSFADERGTFFSHPSCSVVRFFLLLQHTVSSSVLFLVAASSSSVSYFVFLTSMYQKPEPRVRVQIRPVRSSFKFTNHFCSRKRTVANRTNKELEEVQQLENHNYCARMYPDVKLIL